MMKSLGYSNKLSMSYIFGSVSIGSIIMLIVMFSVLSGIAYGFTISLGKAGIAVPFGIPIWAPLLSFILVFMSYLISLWISTLKVRKTKPSILLVDTLDE